MKKSKGYTLLIVLIFSIVIALIGAGLALISQQGFFSTRSNILFNKLMKAAHYGINEAVKRIVNNGGICEEGNLPNDLNVEGAKVKVSTIRRGIICSIRSEAKKGNSEMVLVAATQGFYGIGTYTVKGKVEANIYGGLVSGCDRVNNCSIPGFVASGPIIVTTRTFSCGYPVQAGVYGTPPTFPNVKFYDLTPLVFNVNCFYELLRVFETEASGKGYPMGLGSDPLWIENGTYRQDIEIDKGNLTGCPNPSEIDEASLKMGKINIIFPDLPSIPEDCHIQVDEDVNLNLTTMKLTHKTGVEDLNNCSQVLIETGDNGNIHIEGNATEIKYIYVKNHQGVIVTGAKNGILINLDDDNDVTVMSSFAPFIVYSKSDVFLNKVSFIRVVSLKDIFLSHPNISNSTLITQEDIINQANSLNLSEVNIFAKRLQFGDYKNITVKGGLLYLYILADRERTNDVVLDECQNNNYCGFIGKNLRSLDLGVPSDPVLLILVNSATKISNINTVNINAMFFGQGVTYLTFSGVNRQNYKGILVRNFPNNEPLNINFGSGVYLQFDYGIINILNSKYWFVRKFECIKDNPLIYPQVIQTLHSSY